ncbi:MAG: serine--tRNA ligase, partial [Nitrospinaceae bacterium]|nr:serine--tRNA ligase [Nitrospinaceae bacterium]NIR57289.1 serine--tRNA ligase [Nitrospinaceae bacterium]NIS87741.1 serine--tRNA ligase [Nitrospinaceae bacterium]NIT84611.1 serine--tRNA ligase [Nitrospinaceae bacterium]NIU46790.1 serine--tRNA ligase [Nitrospinaceae bacterium]
IDARRRDALGQAQTLKNRKKTLSAEVGKLKKAGQDAAALMEEVKQISADIKALDDRSGELDDLLRATLLKIPNVPSGSTPDGADESRNEEIRKWGDKPEFGFTPKNHLELGETLGILDMKRATKISGARFAVFRGQGAALLRALIQFMLDTQTRENGYEEMYPPVLVNADSLKGTGQLPKFEEDLFKLRDDELFLIPTAEVPVTNYHRDEILPEESLPVKYSAYTLCFRREAGSHGKDTQGIIRQHQFDKVELVQFVHPDKSYEELEKLVTHAESILRKLNLHYRVVNLCTGDLGFSAAKTYDLEVWLPSQNTYREISSCSNFTDYQARRAMIRYKGKDGGKPALVHTLNGSGLAAGRLFVAILENYQQADGSIRVPEPLRPYLHGQETLAAGN